jgi:hypothetical protein
VSQNHRPASLTSWCSHCSRCGLVPACLVPSSARPVCAALPSRKWGCTSWEWDDNKRAEESQHAVCMWLNSLFYYSTPPPRPASSSSNHYHCCCCCSCMRACVLVVLLGCRQPWCVPPFAAPAAPPVNWAALTCSVCASLAFFHPYAFIPLIFPLPHSFPLMSANGPVHNSCAPNVSPQLKCET